MFNIDLSRQPSRKVREVVTILLSALLFFWLGSLVLGMPEWGIMKAITLLVATITFPYIANACLEQGRPPYAFLIFITLLGVVSIWNSLTQSVSIKQYGDAGFVPLSIYLDQPFSRWLLGTKILAFIYHDVGGAHVFTPQTLTKVAGTLCMLAFMWPPLLHMKARAVLLMPMITPIWFLFLSGYDEYYPLIVGPYLLAAYLILSGQSLGLLGTSLFCGVLPALYIGFAPLAGLLMLRLIIDSRAHAIKAVALSLVTYLLIVEVCSTNGVSAYFTQLVLDLNLGDKNTVYDLYLNKSSSPSSPFFSLRFALSSQHIVELLGLAVIGSAASLAIAIYLLVRYGKYLPRSTGRNRIVPTIFIAWQLFYFIFMIPKLGPVRDLDLFFGVYLLFAMLAGSLMDAISDKEKMRAPLFIQFGSSLGVAICLL